jgi:hypothetical protein
MKVPANIKWLKDLKAFHTMELRSTLKKHSNDTSNSMNGSWKEDANARKLTVKECMLCSAIFSRWMNSLLVKLQ